MQPQRLFLIGLALTALAANLFYWTVQPTPREPDFWLTGQWGATYTDVPPGLVTEGLQSNPRVGQIRGGKIWRDGRELTDLRPLITDAGPLAVPAQHPGFGGGRWSTFLVADDDISLATALFVARRFQQICDVSVAIHLAGRLPLVPRSIEDDASSQRSALLLEPPQWLGHRPPDAERQKPCDRAGVPVIARASD